MKFLYPILFAAAFTVSAFEFTGKVVGVTDGDTKKTAKELASP